MNRLLFPLTIAAALPLMSCQSPMDVAAKRCQSVYPAGSPAYAECWQREYQQQMKFLEDEQERRSRMEMRIRI